MRYAFGLICLILFLGVTCLAEEYEATVTTPSGSYSVPVEVEDGEVTTVYWPSGGNMHVYGAEIDDGEASGTNSRGDTIDISIDDYKSDDESEQ